MKPSSFSSTSIVWIVSLLGVSFLGGLLLLVFADVFSPGSVDADSSSISAIGHHAVAATFENYGWTVIRSTANTLDRVIDGDVLIVAEPVLPEDDEERWETLALLLSESHARLLVLPKRRGTAGKDNKRWLGRTGFVDEGLCVRVLEAAGISGEVTRISQREPMNQDDFDANKLEFTTNRYGIQPHLEAPQLVRSQQLEAIIEAKEGILLGAVETQWGKFFVLSDPDLMANHGIGTGENLELVYHLLSDLREGDSALVFDESMHGIAAPESFWRELLRFPLVLVSITGLLLLLAALWKSMGRFGQPEPVKRTLALGKSYLIENTARLLALGGYSHHSLQRYHEQSTDEVWQSLRSGQPAEKAKQTETLERIEQSRQTKDHIGELGRLVKGQKKHKALGTQGRELATRLYRWRREMIDGIGVDNSRR
ncbi:MAG: DUF4350 domain-containing protein [Planctomycetota bacterium]